MRVADGHVLYLRFELATDAGFAAEGSSEAPPESLGLCRDSAREETAS